jgi:hypothetical protein
VVSVLAFTQNQVTEGMSSGKKTFKTEDSIASYIDFFKPRK